ncbi:MAG: flagellar hook-length control protein FliK [bacterium]|nr:flagellar hook-length control protein FliK [bacterium]
MKADNLIYLAVKKLEPANAPVARKIKSRSGHGEVIGDFAALLQSAPFAVASGQKAVTGKPGVAAAVEADAKISTLQTEAGIRVEQVKQNTEGFKTAPVEFDSRQLRSIQPKSAIGKAVNQTTDEHLPTSERPTARPPRAERENLSILEPASPASTAKIQTSKPAAGAVVTPDLESERIILSPVMQKPTVAAPGIVRNDSRSVAPHPAPVLNETAIPAQRATSITASPSQSSLKPIPVTIDYSNDRQSATVISLQDHPKADVKPTATVAAGKAAPERVEPTPTRSDFVQAANQKPNQVFSQQGISTLAAANTLETSAPVAKTAMKGISDVTAAILDHTEAPRIKNIAAHPTTPIVVKQVADHQSETVEAVPLLHLQKSALQPIEVTQAAPIPQPAPPQMAIPVVVEAVTHRPMAQPVLVKHTTEFRANHTTEELVQPVVKSNPEGVKSVDKPAGEPDVTHQVVSEAAAPLIAPAGGAKSDYAAPVPPKSFKEAVFNPAQHSHLAAKINAVPVFPETVFKKEGTVLTPDLHPSNRSSEAQPAVSQTNQPDPTGYQPQSNHRDGDPADSKTFPKSEESRPKNPEPQVISQPMPGNSPDAATTEKLQPPEAALKDWLDQMPKDPNGAIHRIQNFKDLAEKIQAQAKLLKIGEVAELRLTLTPPHLGSLLVQIEAEGKDVKLHITTERHEATTALIEVRTELTSIIAAQGYNLTQCEIESRAQQNRWTPQTNEKQNSQSDQDGSRDKEHASPDGKNGEPRRKLDLGYNTFDLVA